ncbi:MAG: hypothetical protein K8F91_14735 [Candidatus Obscuribacterales bacterium]|nr:hypothetical protein [Candidatus Obscuribacterales bacterium]
MICQEKGFLDSMHPCLLLLFLLFALVVLVSVYRFVVFFLRRARERKAIQGARLWLTGFYLFVLFSGIGLFWGLVFSK